MSEIVSDPRFKRYLTKPEPPARPKSREATATKQEPTRVDKPVTPDEPAAEDDLYSEYAEEQEQEAEEQIARPQTA